MLFYCRWYWNKLRYQLGFTQISPAGHEFRRMMIANGWKLIK